MQHILSTHLTVNHRLTVAWLSRVEKAGLEAVEIFCARQHLDYRNKAQVAELGHWFRDSQLKLHALHSPMFTDEVWGQSGPQADINITHPVKAIRNQWVDEIKRVLEHSEVLPFRYLVQHLGVSGQEFDDYAIEAGFRSLEELSVFARGMGVEILLENTPNALSSAERLEFFNRTTHLNLNYVFDSGHANLGAGVEHEFEIMKPRIRSLHLHDNDGKEDSHLFPLDAAGTIDWTRTMELLRGCPEGQFPLLLELRESPELQNPLDDINRVFEELESLEHRHD
jgi:sugar phosphate isomerase/epimerase